MSCSLRYQTPDMSSNQLDQCETSTEVHPRYDRRQPWNDTCISTSMQLPPSQLFSKRLFMMHTAAL